MNYEIIKFIASQADNVQLAGLCPICKTGRNQYGVCWNGHIVIDVPNHIKPEGWPTNHVNEPFCECLVCNGFIDPPPR